MTFHNSMGHADDLMVLQNQTTLMKLHRDREVIRQFRARFNSDMAAFRFRLELLRVMEQQRLQQRSGFDPAQPRDEDGRWTDGGASDQDQPQSPSDSSASPQQRIADVINICMLSGAGSAKVGNLTSYFGLYECRDGSTIRVNQWTPIKRPFIRQP